MGYFHVLNRGNNRQKLFHSRTDFKAFLAILAEETDAHRVRLIGYCLMPNHWHFVAEATEEEQLSRWVYAITNRHARTYHQRHGGGDTGHVYQGRFKSFPIQDDRYLYTVLRYVETNPVRAGFVARAETWTWSSLSTDEVPCRPALAPWDRREAWVEDVNRRGIDYEIALLREKVQRGAPLGDAAWVQTTAKEHGLEMSLRPRGRPRKNA